MCHCLVLRSRVDARTWTWVGMALCYLTSGSCVPVCTENKASVGLRLYSWHLKWYCYGYWFCHCCCWNQGCCRLFWLLHQESWPLSLLSIPNSAMQASYYHDLPCCVFHLYQFLGDFSWDLGEPIELASSSLQFYGCQVGPKVLTCATTLPHSKSYSMRCYSVFYPSV